jgi:hypothetical protein
MDAENLDALTPAELEALLEQALNPQVPVTMLYAVLERIGAAGAQAAPARPGATQDPEATTVLPGQGPASHLPHPPVAPRGAATDRAVRPERPLPPKGPKAGPSQQPNTQGGRPNQGGPAYQAPPVGQVGQAGQGGYPQAPQPAPGTSNGPNGPTGPNPIPHGNPNAGHNPHPGANPNVNPNAQPTTLIPVVPGNPQGHSGPNGLPPTAVIPIVPAAPPSRAAHAPLRRPGYPGGETGR